MNTMAVDFIGVGIMDDPVVKHLLKGGYGVVAFDVLGIFYRGGINKYEKKYDKDGE
ncbi:MAG: hypothetical protein QGG48_04970 [Desulfatiglandales bacterium]|nr:hypothetical protein [Desulfatiglandales bacterium]